MYDIEYYILDYMFPWEYSLINKELHSHAIKVKEYETIYNAYEAYNNGSTTYELVKLTSVKYVIRLLDKRLIKCTGELTPRISCNLDYVNYINKALDDRNVHMFMFLKDAISWNDIPYIFFKPIKHIYEMLYSGNMNDFVCDVGITIEDIRHMSPKYIIENISLILEACPDNKYSIFERIHKQNNENMSILLMLMKMNYYIGNGYIKYNYLVKHKLERYVGCLYPTSWIVSNCKLDIIRVSCEFSRCFKVIDLIKNRHYPVFKTFYPYVIEHDLDTYSLLQLAVDYHNTEAFKVLINTHSYSKEQLLSLKNVIKKGIKSIIKTYTT